MRMFEAVELGASTLPRWRCDTTWHRGMRPPLVARCAVISGIEVLDRDRSSRGLCWPSATGVCRWGVARQLQIGPRSASSRAAFWNRRSSGSSSSTTGRNSRGFRPAMRSLRTRTWWTWRRPEDEAPIAEIAGQIFDAGRFHRDPLIDPRVGDLRYRRWVSNAFLNPRQIVLKCRRGMRCKAFFVVESPAPIVASGRWLAWRRDLVAEVSARASGVQCSSGTGRRVLTMFRRAFLRLTLRYSTST